MHDLSLYPTEVSQCQVSPMELPAHAHLHISLPLHPNFSPCISPSHYTYLYLPLTFLYLPSPNIHSIPCPGPLPPHFAILTHFPATPIIPHPFMLSTIVIFSFFPPGWPIPSPYPCLPPSCPPSRCFILFMDAFFGSIFILVHLPMLIHYYYGWINGIWPLFVSWSATKQGECISIYCGNHAQKKHENIQVCPLTHI